MRRRLTQRECERERGREGKEYSRVSVNNAFIAVLQLYAYACVCVCVSE